MDTSNYILCKNFLSGNCRFGNSCKFVHSIPHTYSNKRLCKHFIAEYCRFGNTCKFVHQLPFARFDSKCETATHESNTSVFQNHEKVFARQFLQPECPRNITSANPLQSLAKQGSVNPVHRNTETRVSKQNAYSYNSNALISTIDPVQNSALKKYMNQGNIDTIPEAFIVFSLPRVNWQNSPWVENYEIRGYDFERITDKNLVLISQIKFWPESWACPRVIDMQFWMKDKKIYMHSDCSDEGIDFTSFLKRNAISDLFYYNDYRSIIFSFFRLYAKNKDFLLKLFVAGKLIYVREIGMIIRNFVVELSQPMMDRKKLLSLK